MENRCLLALLMGVLLTVPSVALEGAVRVGFGIGVSSGHNRSSHYIRSGQHYRYVSPYYGHRFGQRYHYPRTQYRYGGYYGPLLYYNYTAPYSYTKYYQVRDVYDNSISRYNGAPTLYIDSYDIGKPLEVVLRSATGSLIKRTSIEAYRSKEIGSSQYSRLGKSGQYMFIYSREWASGEVIQVYFDGDEGRHFKGNIRLRDSDIYVPYEVYTQWDGAWTVVIRETRE